MQSGKRMTIVTHWCGLTASRIAKATGFQHDTQENAVYEIRKNLDDWADGLPQRLKLDNLSPDMKSFRGAVHLHMNHSQILIYMGRLSLLRRLQKHLKDQSSGIQAEELSDSEASLIRDCVSAAFKIIQLINYLHENGRLARFSFTDLNCCSIAALIIMIHELIQQHPLYRSSMETVMRAMTHMATGCSNAKQGLKLIKDLERVTALLKSKMTRNREKDCVADNATGYDEWENWVASKGEIVQSSSGVLTSPDAESLQSHLDLGQPSELNGHTGEAIESEAYVSYDFLDDQHGGDGMQSAFYSVWPDNLGSLGLSVFEDFTFPS
ncbi:hypothetical protein NW762_010906 [Fusarium torreyae]|uniref:Uncharacterized protein n=1 Tax=Fusarium torreyae TaxID=1237075 RepID=A0A9W8VA47_9HYPO|nr:hypothetical protein NW762_010906 [Fusarium torreyae]